MRVNGYELVSEWKTSQCGWTAKAKKGGILYFLKQYQTPAAPLKNNTLDAKTFAHNQKLFDHFLETRKKVNTKIRSITGAGGNIVIPAEEFMLENHYVEAAEFVDGIVPEEELEGVLSSLSVDVKKLLMQTAAGALSSVHKLGIVHSDLKLKNVLLVRNAAGNYVAKLIDFDSSYPIDDKPDEIVGDINYYSPELGAYADIEDEEEQAEAGKKLTEKSDIFSLGLIFHFYLSGEMPGFADLPERLKKRLEKGKKIYSWIALNGGGRLVISPSIESPKYRSLIEDMLKLDPAERPTALDVLKRLKGEDPVIEEPWPEHGIVLDLTELRNAGIVGVKKVNEGGKKYELTSKDGSKRIADADDLGTSGYLKKSCGFCEPWEEHAIAFDRDRIKSRGFVGVSRKESAGIKGYTFYRADSSTAFFKPDMLKAMKYAVPTGEAASSGRTDRSTRTGVSEGSGASASTSKPTAASTGKPTASASSAGTAEPWPEHRIRFAMDVIRAKGFTGVKQAELGGVKGYELARSDGGKQFMRVEMMIVQKIAEKV
ncbi:MAG: protein kinase [Lachnospiraceae bacterium]|nr:protein kinase [Lachnospiraceae bacterium]